MGECTDDWLIERLLLNSEQYFSYIYNKKFTNKESNI